MKNNKVNQNIEKVNEAIEKIDVKQLSMYDKNDVKMSMCNAIVQTLYAMDESKVCYDDWCYIANQFSDCENNPDPNYDSILDFIAYRIKCLIDDVDDDMSVEYLRRVVIYLAFSESIAIDDVSRILDVLVCYLRKSI